MTNKPDSNTRRPQAPTPAMAGAEILRSAEHRHVQARLAALLDLVPEAVITIDARGHITSFSLGAEKIFGYGFAEVIGKSINLLMPEREAKKHNDYLDHYRDTGEKKIIGIGREVNAKRKDGTVFPSRLSVNEMHVDGRVMFSGVVQDLSELKKAQAFSDRLGRILDGSLNEIYVFDAETLHFVQVNYGARKNTGYSAEEFSTLTPIDLKPEFGKDTFERLIEPLRKGAKDLLVFQTTQQRKDGSTYRIEVHLQFIEAELPPVFAAIVQDITEIERQQKMLQQSQKMEAIGQLTGGIAHDFNNLLTVIIGNNELLGRKLGDDARMHRFLDNSTGAAERAAQLTGQLLSFARKQPLQPKVIDPNSLVLDMMNMLQRTLGETILVEAALEPNIGRILADPAQMQNAILNLVINSRDAMPCGGRLIVETSNVELDSSAVTLREDAMPGQYVRLSVRDTGSGIAPGLQERVLEPFFTTKPPGQGTGLGLSMVHGFARQSGGHVEISSEVGHGTAVSLYLPNATADPVMRLEDEQSTGTRRSAGETVLVVEDDQSVKEVTVSRLEHLGYKVLEATSGPDALKLLSTGVRVDLVLSDMVMPGGMTGGQLVEVLRKEYPWTKQILSSGYAPDLGLSPIDTPWLRKPYTLAELARMLQDVLDNA